ncbi:unnamed protein product [Symbiodinium sp. CCMP2592]|nr:unnamed protein product [Symbiodinium sp. CCMP2592]
MAGQWAKARGYSLSIDEFSLSEERFPSLNAKGYEIKLLCVWLAEIAPAYARSPKASSDTDHADVLSMTARALAINIKILEKRKYEITREDVDRGVRACHRFVVGYIWLAYSCYLDGQKLYKLRPKTLELTAIARGCSATFSFGMNSCKQLLPMHVC